MSTIEVGAKLEGKVTGITHFGAFVELPGNVTGLVHISEIADSYVKDVKDHLKLEDVVTVKVINVDKDGKIGLSIKKAVDKPPEAAGSGGYRERSGPPREGGGGFRERSGPPREGGGGFGGRGGGFGGRGGDRRQGGGGFAAGGRLTFEDKMSRFMKDSEERMSSLKKNTEGKRGGRGAKRV
jgi:S1 RNA binding domain protein